MTSKVYKLGSKGTPQGAVLALLLFNLALRGLPEALRAVSGVEHAIYADDVTLWCRTGSDAKIEERLQEAAGIVEKYAESCRMKCASKKSELLILRNPYEKLEDHIEIAIGGMRVPKPTEICILGQLIGQGRGNKSMINKLDTMTMQVCGMLKRIMNCGQGIKEKEAMQLVQAFIISKISYGTPYLVLYKAERQKFDLMIKRAYKNALGLPERTATELLLKLGVHNTINEIRETHIPSPLKTLTTQANRSWLMEKLRMAVRGGSHRIEDLEQDLPLEFRQKIVVESHAICTIKDTWGEGKPEQLP
ncbi:hypothetical protein HPB47_018227 [Ixodes persulcatus]|uniref:Uncharacterized protein n=1 Tax=Ixodes persulcatus TaxID=34615 RepID=A0AC60QLB3_IXOPE|nr:hypothetical protein HPB47_018227 [Ixodes persulcatus]